MEGVSFILLFWLHWGHWSPTEQCLISTSIFCLSLPIVESCSIIYFFSFIRTWRLDLLFYSQIIFHQVIWWKLSSHVLTPADSQSQELGRWVDSWVVRRVLKLCRNICILLSYLWCMKFPIAGVPGICRYRWCCQSKDSIAWKEIWWEPSGRCLLCRGQVCQWGIWWMKTLSLLNYSSSRSLALCMFV